MASYTLSRQLKSKDNASCFDDHSDIIKPFGSLNGKSLFAYSEVGLTFSQCYNHPTYLPAYKTESVSSLTRSLTSQTIRKEKKDLYQIHGV